MILISTKQIITYSTDMSSIEYLNMQSSTSRIMICEFVYKQILYYSSRIISDSWTNQREKSYLTTAILTNIELITTAEEECLRISWKRSALTLNTRTNESRIKLSESNITTAICSKTFNSENMSYMTSLSSKCQSSSSSKHWLRPHTRILKRHILKMSEKMSDISQSVNQLIKQSQSIRSIRSLNQLINRHQSFRSHSDKHFFNHYTFNHYTLNCHTIHHTLQSINSINSTIDRHTHLSNHRDHHTLSIKFDLLRKHLNRIYVNQFNHLHLHRNHLNHLHSYSHQHLNSSQNRFTSINHSMNRINHSMIQMIDRDNWRYWIKSIRRTKNSATQAAILTLKCWNFMINVDVRDYSSTRICRVPRLCLRARHLTTTIQICNSATYFMNFAST
jgi:hypothetical protein